MKASRKLYGPGLHPGESQHEDQELQRQHLESRRVANQNYRRRRYEREVIPANSGPPTTDFSAWCTEVKKAQEQPALSFRDVTDTLDDNKSTNRRENSQKVLAEAPELRRVARFASTEPSDASVLGEPGPAISISPSLPLRKAKSEQNFQGNASRDVARALAKTMLGDWLYKDSHDPKFWDSRKIVELWRPTPSYENLKPTGLSGPGTRQKRWFWLAPLERKICWQRSSVLPTSYGFGGEESSVRHIPIVAVFEAGASSHDVSFNCGSEGQLHPRTRAILVAGPQRMIRLTTLNKNTYDTWLLALRYIATASTNDIEENLWKKTIQNQLNVLQPFDFPERKELGSNTREKSRDIQLLSTRPRQIPPRDKKTALLARSDNGIRSKFEKPLPITPRPSSSVSHARRKPQSSPVPANVQRRRQNFNPVADPANEASTMIENTVPWSTPKTPKELRRGRKLTREGQTSPPLEADVPPIPQTIVATRSVSVGPSSFPSYESKITSRPTTSGVTSEVPLTTGLDDYLLVFERMFRAGASRAQSSTRSHKRYEDSEPDTATTTVQVPLPRPD